MFGKVFGHLANLLIVDTLAKNRRFQALALKIDAELQKKKIYAEQGMQILEEQKKKLETKSSEALGMNVHDFTKELSSDIKREFKAFTGDLKPLSNIPGMISWHKIPETERLAWQQLGWTEEIWNKGNPKEYPNLPKWASLNSGEQAAVKYGLKANTGAEWDFFLKNLSVQIKREKLK